MEGTVSAVLEVLLAILPNNDLLRAITVVLLFLILTKYPLVWCGLAIRYMYRWVQCRCYGVHTDEAVTASKNAYGQMVAGTKRCLVCGRIEHFAEF